MDRHKFLECTDRPEPKLQDTARQNSLHEAYKKHSTELASIEDRENKFLLLILAVYGAGATAFSTINLQGASVMPWCFAGIVCLTIGVGQHTVHEDHDLRRAVRDMLVRCELAMEFYTPDVFLKDMPLYGAAERCYSSKGGSRQIWGYAIVFGGGILLIWLIFYNYCRGPLPHH
jgi:hypothetical protein